MFNYHSSLRNNINRIKKEGRYRDLIAINKQSNKFPTVLWGTEQKEVTMWCSNDYLGMSQYPNVIDSAKKALLEYGMGSGGTRNIGGNSGSILRLEQEIASLHNKEAALVFTSGYVSNDATLTTLAKIFPDLVYLSDELNHASMISGIKNSRAEKQIYCHRDTDNLEKLLKNIDINRPKIIVFESTYSMNGLISPIKKICELAKTYNALTYIDEVHSVGLYGSTGAGIANMLGVDHQIDIIQGTLAKAYGVIGGYISGNYNLIESIRLNASGFIFTTSLPTSIVEASIASITHLKNSKKERAKHQEVVKKTKETIKKVGVNILENDTHIIPIIIGDPELTKKASQLLINKYNIFIQHINFPTVPRKTERLRITPTPFHSDKMIQKLAHALADTFEELDIKN